MTATTIERTQQRSPGLFLVTIFLFGPVASLMLLAAQSTNWGESLVRAGMIVVLVFWSPFAPMTIPALAMQGARDDALIGWPWLARAVVLIPYLAVSSKSPVRVVTWANLIGVAIAAVWLLSYL